MNVLNLCRDIFLNFDVFIDGILSEVFVKIIECDRKIIYGFVRLSGIVFICILVNIVVVFCCIGFNIDGDIVVNFLINGVYLYRNFKMVYICINIVGG